MAKRLNEGEIRSELTGQSAFFRKPAATLPKERTQSPKAAKPRDDQSAKPNDRTVTANGTSERPTQSETPNLLDDVAQGNTQHEQRARKRYSFEAFVDQIEAIDDVQYRYRKRTGNRLSLSRFIREAIDRYLAEADRLLGSSDQK